MLRLRHWFLLMLWSAGGALAAAQAGANYPERPVRLIVPFAPGGATDIIARVIAQRLVIRLGQQVAVDNRPGAATTIGSAVVAKAAPDGYTLLLAPTGFVISPFMVTDLPYDPQKDFTPVTLLAVSAFILVTHPSVPAKNVAELVALAKAKPGSLAYCSSGSGALSHLAGEMFRLSTGIDLVHVPYKGGGPAIIDLIAGQVSLMFAIPIEVDPYVRAGRLRVLAATSQKRLAALAQTPTIAESGYPGFEVQAFFGVLAPAGTPKDIVGRLAVEFERVMQLPDVRERFAAQSAEPAVRAQEAFAAFLKIERDKWADIVKRSGAKID